MLLGNSWTAEPTERWFSASMPERRMYIYVVQKLYFIIILFTSLYQSITKAKLTIVSNWVKSHSNTMFGRTDAEFIILSYPFF